MEEVAAKLRGARLSAQKARLVADQVRGKPVAEALNILAFSPKKAAVLVRKVLQSAIANAEENNGMDIDELRVSTICVDEGMTLKRILPRAKGRADRIMKRTCHITVKVEVRPDGSKSQSSRYSSRDRQGPHFRVVRRARCLCRQA